MSGKFYVRVLDRGGEELVIDTFEFNNRRDADKFAREYHRLHRCWIKIYNEFQELIEELIEWIEDHEPYA